MEKLEILFNALVITFIIISLILILQMLGNQMWAMQLLKNKCIAECLEINKLAKAGEVLCAC